MTVVIDYGTGNIRSVANALRRLGLRFCGDVDVSAGSSASFCLTDDPEVIRRADHVILPGVGEAARAMEQLRLKGLDEVIRSLTCPVLGICIGMQLMCRHSEEGDVDCLGIFPADVIKLPSYAALKGRREILPCNHVGSASADGPVPGTGTESLKIPHVGWNTVSPAVEPAGECDGSGIMTSGMFRGLEPETYFYYVHSYAAQVCPTTAAVTEYGVRFSAAMARDNFFGTQFHPEKSGAAGRTLLKNFLEM